MLPPQLGKSFSGFVKGYGGQCLNKAREAHPHARSLGWRTAAKAAGRLYTCQPSLHETGASSTERLGKRFHCSRELTLGPETPSD